MGNARDQCNKYTGILNDVHGTATLLEQAYAWVVVDGWCDKAKTESEQAVLDAEGTYESVYDTSPYTSQYDTPEVSPLDVGSKPNEEDKPKTTDPRKWYEKPINLAIMGLVGYYIWSKR